MKKLLLASLITLLSVHAQAYMNLLSTGELTPTNHWAATGYLEGVFNKYDGVNVNARGSYGISDELQVDAELGTGPAKHRATFDRPADQRSRLQALQPRDRFHVRGLVSRQQI